MYSFISIPWDTIQKPVVKHYVYYVLARDGSTWRCEFIFSDPVYCWCRFVLGGGDRNYTRNTPGNRYARPHTCRTKKVSPKIMNIEPWLYKM